LRAEIEFIDTFFTKNEIDEIWIVHPDPFPKTQDQKKRLTSPHFLAKYKNLIKTNGILHLKTDDHSLYLYSLKTIKSSNPTNFVFTEDLYNSPLVSNHHSIKTRYEQKALETNGLIYYIMWSY
jgi:tRNA (guanine-N7-)-methyltransferase